MQVSSISAECRKVSRESVISNYLPNTVFLFAELKKFEYYCKSKLNCIFAIILIF